METATASIAAAIVQGAARGHRPRARKQAAPRTSRNPKASRKDSQCRASSAARDGRASFVMLLLAYVGSRFVMEVILGRTLA